jgi:hypothetical protein
MSAGIISLRPTPAASLRPPRPKVVEDSVAPRLGAAPRPDPSERFPIALADEAAAQIATVVEQLPGHREPPPPPPPAPPPDPLAAYRGLEAWIDLFDYGLSDSMPLDAIVDEMAARGVRTLFVQTGRWNTPALARPAELDVLVERAHARGMAVIGWYLPGFADIDRDVRASMAVLEHVTHSGQRFDGFAPDIEDRREVADDLASFNAGVVRYSRALRAAAPGTILGAIVLDAQHNARAPLRWEGFPWPEIAATYDVVMPMAYWTVTTGRGCPAADAGAYLREVAVRTRDLMGADRPLHLIGGIADCIRPEEIDGFVDALRDAGSIGGGLYDFVTISQRGPGCGVEFARSPEPVRGIRRSPDRAVHPLQSRRTRHRQGGPVSRGDPTPRTGGS